MKHSTNTLKTVFKNSILKIAFCSQVLLISFAIPLLYYVSVTTNTEAPQKHLKVITNKGKKALVADERTGNEATVQFPGFLHI